MNSTFVDCGIPGVTRLSVSEALCSYWCSVAPFNQQHHQSTVINHSEHHSQV
jgi:hypothetical protein